MSNEPTEPWVEAMVRVGATDPRNGRPSWNRLAEMAGVSTTTITRMVDGTRNPSPDTVHKVAHALRVDTTWVSAALALRSPVREAYAPPPEARLLTPRQRRAVDELIRAIVSAEGGGAHEDSAAPMNVKPLRDLDVPSEDVNAGTVAARNIGRPSSGQQERAEHHAAGTDNQDPGGMDPA